MKKEINNINFKGLIGYLRRHYGDEGVRLLTQGLINNDKYLIADKYDPLKVTPVQEHHLVDSAYWVSNEFSLELLANVKKVVSGPNPLFIAGENSVIDNLSKGFLFSARIFGPGFAARQVTRLNARFNRTKEARLSRMTGNSAMFELHYKPEYRVTKDVCNWNLGIYSGIAKIAGLQGVRSEEVKCVVDGDEYCAFIITWKRTSPVKRIMNFFIKSVTWKLVEDYESTTRDRDNLIDSLKQSEERYRLLTRRFFKVFNASPNVMCVLSVADMSADGRFIDINESFIRVTGYSREEVIGRSTSELNIWTNPGNLARIRRMIQKQEEIHNMEFNFRTKSGEARVGLLSMTRIDFDGKPCVLINMADITERKQIEQEMARLERLNLVGEMAAGIGHEIRNPMTTVRGFLQLLGSKEECARYSEYYALMIEELDRANSIITEFLSLAKNKKVDMQVCSLNSIIKALSPLIHADAMVFDKHVEIDLEDIPDLLLDEKEIRQLILNLVRNGLEAMSPGGILTIKTFTNGKEIVLTVQDQGKGIEPHLLKKIGTPFFTTKEQGTGLGLAVCYSIAARHKAAIKVETTTKGTTFFVSFKP